MTTVICLIDKDWYAFAACNHQGKPWAYNIGRDARYARSAVEATEEKIKRICRPSRTKDLAEDKARRAAAKHGWKYFGEVHL